MGKQGDGCNMLEEGYPRGKLHIVNRIFRYMAILLLLNYSYRYNTKTRKEPG